MIMKLRDQVRSGGPLHFNDIMLTQGIRSPYVKDCLGLTDSCLGLSRPHIQTIVIVVFKFVCDANAAFKNDISTVVSPKIR